MSDNSSVTETLIKAMEEAEPAEECLIIMTSREGEIMTLCSSTRLSTKLGMIEMARAIVYADVCKAKDE
jgi:hypothetical protein